MSNIITIVLSMLFALCVAAAIGIFLAVIVMLCWNFTMPAIFGLPVITWGKAWCLTFLCHILISPTRINNNK